MKKCGGGVMFKAKNFRIVWVLVAVFFFVSNSFAALPNIKDVAKKALPSVVNISTTQIVKYQNPFDGYGFGQNDPFNDFFKKFFDNMPKNGKTHALGSGFIISKDGYILTNYHVVKKATTIKVTLLNTNEVYDAKIVGSDPKADIALIKIKAKKELPYLELGNSDEMSVGDWVVAVGNPFGLNGTVTAGIISAKGRVIGEGPFDHFIQTDAAINPGNSGGPLLNLDGKVIGINTAIVAGGQGIGFAIPINMAKSEMDFLKAGKSIKRGYLGVTIQPLTPEAAKELGIENAKGAIVSQVMKHSAAYKAGVKPGDIIVSVNDKPIKSASDLPYIISSMKPGTKVKLGIVRNKEKIYKTVKLATRPNEESLADASGSQSDVYKTKFGFSIANITPELAKEYGLKKKHGVVVTFVEPNSFAQMVGVKSGDVIVKLNYKKIDNVNEFKKIEKKANDVIFLHILRGSSHIFITIQR
jgi:serine protease Do